MENKALRSFIAVAELKSFSKAAEQLYISQPAISIHIKSLEEELNRRLIDRSQKGLVLTKEGYELLDYAKKILKLEADFLANKKIESSLLKIGASNIPCAYYLPDLIKDFIIINPKLNFEIVQGDSEDIIEKVQNGNVDVGLIGSSCDYASIQCENFAMDSMIFIVPDTIENRKLLDLDEKDLITKLYSMPFIQRELGSGSRRAAEKLFDSYGLDSYNLKVLAKVSNHEAIVSFVRAGLGVAIVSSKIMAKTFNCEGILEIKINDTPSLRPLNYIYKKDNVMKESTQKFINFIRKYYSYE